MGDGTKARVLKVPTLRLMQRSRSSLEFTADPQDLNSRLPTQPVVAARLPSPFSDLVRKSQIWLAEEVILVAKAFTIRARIYTIPGLIRRSAPAPLRPAPPSCEFKLDFVWARYFLSGKTPRG